MVAGNPERTRELLRFDLQLRHAAAAGRSLEEFDVEEPLRRVPLPIGADSGLRLVGFDEAGRGALAGPVTVACVSLDWPQDASVADAWADEFCGALATLDDSKRVTPRRREGLHAWLRAHAPCGVGHASAQEIDRHGIVGACRRATRRAFQALGVDPDLALLDRGLELPAPSECGTRELASCSLTRGDARSLHIAAASILAKVERDALMLRLDGRFPGYDLSRHKGYGTAAHRSAIRTRGASAIHRRSFLRSIAGRVEEPKSQFC